MKLSQSKHGVTTKRLVKHVERDNYAMILYRIVKKVLYREHSKDLVQLNPLYTIGLEGETY